MQLSLTIVIIIALVTLFLGYFFGLYEGRAQGYKKRKTEEAANPAEHEGATPSAPAVQDDPGLLRLKEENGQLRVEMDGARLNFDLLSAEQRKRLIELITRFRPWVEGRPTPSASAVQPASVSTPPPPPQPPPVPPAGTMSLAQPASLTTPSRPPAAPVKLEQPAAPKTMVGQIDAILQENMADTPLAKRGIKLEESPGGTVTVVVGINRYAGVGEVPEAEVQAAIRAAIAEWERKFTPGL